MRNDRRPDTAEMTLSLLAWRYAAGELPPDQAAAFAARLGTDPAAQDALAEAVRLSARALGQPPPAPDPLTRSAIVERLRPAATLLGGLVALVFRRRPYRGHPLTWAGVGAGLAAGVVGVGTWLADADPAPSGPRTTVLAPQPEGDAAPGSDPIRTVANPEQAPPPVGVPNTRTEGGGGGGDPLPHNPATTFLPPHLGPDMPGDGMVGSMKP
jgi:anti-sigma factor RsiW